ncbi:MAG: hypothetical protein CL608_06475 [Anaerolineaceae bacterium]|nr:hypothetical protein [Anaerolineaceae bacterium]
MRNGRFHQKDPIAVGARQVDDTLATPQHHILPCPIVWPGLWFARHQGEAFGELVARLPKVTTKRLAPTGGIG